jgi:hypothetical protein
MSLTTSRRETPLILRKIVWLRIGGQAWIWAALCHEALMMTGTLISLFPHVAANPEYFKNDAKFWFQWDSLWYIAIGQHGYVKLPGVNGLQATAFFPLVPMIINVVGKWGAVVLVQGAFVGTLYLMKLFFKRKGLSETQGNLALWLFALNPASVYYTTLYAELWTVMLTLLSLQCAVSERWKSASLFGALASLSQGVGVLVGIFPFVLLIQSVLSRRWDVARQAVVWGIGCAVGLLSYVVYLGIKVHHPLAFSTVQSAIWGAHWEVPWNLLYQAFVWTVFRHHKFIGITVLAIFLYITGAILWCIHSLKPGREWESIATSLYICSGILISLSFSEGFPLHSQARIASIYFPMFGGLALISSKKLVWFILLFFGFVAFVGASLFSHQLWFQ